MACAYIAAHPARRRRTVFTVHNLAFQGLFPAPTSALLGLPARFMAPDGLEYHQQLSFMKAGLEFADRVTTVSPTYAREIATPEFGCGLDGVIRGRGGDVSGILNGVDARGLGPGHRPRPGGPLRRRASGRQGALQGGAAGRARARRPAPTRRCSASSAG